MFDVGSSDDEHQLLTGPGVVDRWLQTIGLAQVVLCR